MSKIDTRKAFEDTWNGMGKSQGHIKVRIRNAWLNYKNGNMISK